MSEQQRRRQRRRNNIASSLLFLAFAVVLAAIAYVYIQDQREPEVPPLPPRPTAQAGKLQLIDVIDALRAQDLTVESQRGGGASPDFTPPGQKLIVDGTAAYAFIYPDVASQADEYAALDPTIFELTTPSGAPIITDPSKVRFAANSNVILAVDDGSDDLFAKITAAVEGFP